MNPVSKSQAKRIILQKQQKPDPDCQWCKGSGIMGGCTGRHPVDPTHMHTLSFCECVESVEVDQ